MELCMSCGERAFFGVVDVCYETREIQLDACCESNLSGWLDAFADTDRRTRVNWMARETGLAVRDVIVDGSVMSWTIDYGLELRPTTFSEASAFVGEHHSHNKPPVGWKYGCAVFNGDSLLGVVVAGRPVSAALQKQGCLEINRNCVKTTFPARLAWNVASMLYGEACREGFRRGYDRVITYTLASERGTSLRAAGFVPVARSRGGSWNRSSRPREDRSSTKPKIRWERWKSGVPVHQLDLKFDVAELDLSVAA
jgi:hypothetical protein